LTFDLKLCIIIYVYTFIKFSKGKSRIKCGRAEKMTRRKARELAFSLLFEQKFDLERNIEEIYDTAIEVREAEDDSYVREIVNGVLANREEIFSLIEKHSHGWNINRISNTSLSIMQVAVFEMLYTDLPLKIAINEAIELSKIYDDEKARPFVNGILNSIAGESSGKQIDEQK